MAKKFVFANNPLLAGPALNEREATGIPYREIPLELIDRDMNQPRVNFDEEKLGELAQSIRTYGVLSPILVRPGRTKGRYSLISGERRFRASGIVGLASIPAIVDSGDDEGGARTLSIQLVENIQRDDLTPLERAHAIGALKEAHQLSVRDVADKLGISKSMVQRSLEILELPDDLLNALREGAAESKILLLSKIDSPEIRASYLKDLDVLTRTQLRREVDKDDEAAAKKELSPEDRRIVEEAQHALGLRVTMARTTPGGRGKLSIEFYNDDDLQVIFRKLVAEG